MYARNAPRIHIPPGAKDGGAGHSTVIGRRDKLMQGLFPGFRRGDYCPFGLNSAFVDLLYERLGFPKWKMRWKAGGVGRLWERILW